MDREKKEGTKKKGEYKGRKEEGHKERKEKKGKEERIKRRERRKKEWIRRGKEKEQGKRDGAAKLTNMVQKVRILRYQCTRLAKQAG